MPSTLVERQDVDVVEKIVPSQRILDLHKQASNTEMAWAKWLASRPMIQKEPHRLLQCLLSICVLGEAERIEGIQSGSRVRRFSLGPSSVFERLAAPSSVRVSRIEEVLECALKPIVFRVA
jgi:hypothetical protein